MEQCRYYEEIVDLVPYGSTTARLISMNCHYEEPKNIEDAKCGPSCPGYDPTRPMTATERQMHEIGL